jgi:DNA-binding response OmpR family regulator
MAGRSFHGERILLVEDNPRLLRSMAFLLHVIGFEVMTACDGIEALDILRMRTSDIILSDIDMPHLDGYELLRQVRLDVRWSRIPFIFASDKYSLDDLMFALDLGADDYLPKPFDIHDALEVIERVLPAPSPKYRRLVS